MKLQIAFIAGAVALCFQSAASAGENTSFERDRGAILAMAGKFRVEFNFEETVALAEGYELRESYHADALELVKVVEDRGKLIVLQHILLADDGLEVRVVKHWGQIWKYENPVVIEYQGDRTWTKRVLEPAEVEGSWTQLVTQTDDSPRYESWGTWSHEGNRSAWQSHDTARPLPRREYRKRSDYDILRAVNRHVITPNGWVHEQYNRKWIKEENRFLCHETGLNRYTRCGEDFARAEAEWEAAEGLWHDVRMTWGRVIRENDVIAYREEVDGLSLVRSVNGLAKRVREGESVGPRAVENLITSFTKS